MKTLKLMFLSDPGHGWLACQRRLLIDLRIIDKVTAYSYQQGDTVYLEEDCDAGLLIEALKKAGRPYELTEHHTDSNSPIRRCPRFKATRAEVLQVEGRLPVALGFGGFVYHPEER